MKLILATLPLAIIVSLGSIADSSPVQVADAHPPHVDVDQAQGKPTEPNKAVCHGNRTLIVPARAAQQHLDHGDVEGWCK